MGEGDLPKGNYVTPQAYFIQSVDKGEGGVKNLKKWVTSFMDCPFPYLKNKSVESIKSENFHGFFNIFQIWILLLEFLDIWEMLEWYGH